MSSSAQPGQPDDAITTGELLISYVLRAGVVASMAVILLGVVLMFLHHPGYWRSLVALQELTAPGASFPHSLYEVEVGLREGHGQAVVCLGLLLLIATPMLRVAVSIVVFAVERDLVFVLITSIVLALLLLSFFLGKVE